VSARSATSVDTTYTTIYPPKLPTVNAPGLSLNGPPSYSYCSTTDATSYPPGGPNFAFCDRSVRFIKNTIQPWTFMTGAADCFGDAISDGSFNASTIIWGTTSASAPGVYQALSTRAGRGAISSDSHLSATLIIAGDI
jgi:hypothetical protein